MRGEKREDTEKWNGVTAWWEWWKGLWVCVLSLWMGFGDVAPEWASNTRPTCSTE